MAIPSWLASVAPTIATALGGPLAGLAVTSLAKVFGVDSGDINTMTTAVNDAIQTASMSEEGLEKIKAAEAEMAQIVAKYNLDVQTLENADRASARQREISTGDIWTPRVIATVVISGYFIVLGCMIRWGIAADASGSTFTLIGGLNFAFGSIIGYYFGSTKGSADKTALIAKAASGDKHLP